MSDKYKYPYIKEEGSLYIPTSNRSGKRFQIWTFKPVNGKRFEIEIMLMYPSKEKTLRFSAISEYLSQVYETPNIDELRKLVDADLQSSCRLLNGIKWEEWYEVVIGSGYHEGDNKSAISISYGKLKRGMHPTTGEPVTIHNNKVILPFPKSKKSGEKSCWNSSFSDSDEVSYIPVTQDNTHALELIIKKLTTLKNEISNFLSQDNIKNTICNMSNKLLLEEIL